MAIMKYSVGGCMRRKYIYLLPHSVMNQNILLLIIYKCKDYFSYWFQLKIFKLKFTMPMWILFMHYGTTYMYAVLTTSPCSGDSSDIWNIGNTTYIYVVLSPRNPTSNAEHAIQILLYFLEFKAHSFHISN